MEDVAALGLAVDSKPVEKGARELDRLSAAAKKAESAAGGFGTKASAAANKVANDNRRAAVSVEKLSGSYRVLLRLAPALGAAIAAAFSVQPMFAFKDALAEVSTLVDIATFDMQSLEKSALEQSAAFGGTAAGQAKAYYQVISAGASSAAEATDILTAANKLAVGGVTDVRTAADGLTSVLNAYGSQVESATAVSDALFVGMRAGKTTIGELSASLGKVAPLAAQTGVSFDELVASVSALTKGGIATTEAVTGVRAILAAVAKPTKEATDLSKELGIQFSSAALKSKGFAGFVQDLVKQTGGSTDALAQLFGGVEALVPILALSGQAGVDFAAILEQMGVKAGATEEAFDKMANSPGFQAGRVWSALQAEVLGVSGAMSGALVAALKAVADNMGTIASLVKVAGAAMLVAFGPAILSAMATGFGTFVGAVIFGIKAITTAMMTNPIGFLLVAITSAIVAAYEFRDKISEVFGVDVVGVFKTVSNFILNSFTAAYEDLKFIWGNFGDIMGAAVIGGVNIAIRAINALIDSAKAGINLLIDGINKIPGIDIAKVGGSLNLEEMANPAAERLEKANKAHRANVEEIMSRDTIGGLLGSDGETKSSADSSVAELQKLIDQLNNGGVTVPEIGGGGGQSSAEKAANSYRKIVDGAKEFIATQELEARALGMTEQAANALRYEQDMLNQAANDNINLTAAQKEEISGLAQSMSAAEVATKALKETFDFARDVAGGFVSDLRSGLKQGESFWESFKNAALNALDKIVDKLLNDVLDALFQLNGAASGFGGGGGFLGGLIGVVGSLFGFAGGGYTGHGAKHQAAGIVHKGEFVFSKAATQRIGIGNLDRMHKQAKGYAEGGPVGLPRMHAPANERGANVVVEGTQVVINGNPDKQTREELRRMLEERDKKLARDIPKMVDKRNFDSSYRKVRA
ncbi:phage tail tape measure protein [Filomicrobium sp.]|uniref:phage tail tape measure protein n=1 Tax=Filomicrobium sp. TaxID=2024831 RepID=UPI002583785B|nr:phage tail tape measure protein [Filomicrobium sp.]MCV0371674.1 phage tail tape measure protein [Filomicrobium sp.]